MKYPSYGPDPVTLHALVDGSQMEPNNANAYINDITTGVRSSMRLFADDSKVYRIIYDENDEKQLQCDLIMNTLKKWSEN